MASRHQNSRSQAAASSGRVPCQFKNVHLKPNAARMICNNINATLRSKRIIPERPIQLSDIEEISCYERSIAYFIRYHLRDILTSDHSYVWFHIQTKPLDSLENRKHLMRTEDNKEIRVDYSFGSMLDYGTFIEHTNERALAKIFVQRSSRAIKLQTRNCTFAIPLENIDRQILINHTTDDESIKVVFMLKAPPIVDKRAEIDLLTNRLVDEVALCSDLRVRFFPATEAWHFLHELPIAGYSDRPGDELFHINFSRFESHPHSKIDVPFGKPQYSSPTDSYGMEMLWSLGHIFRDKYIVDTDSIATSGNDSSRNVYDVFCTMWHRLKENHCYHLKDAWKDSRIQSQNVALNRNNGRTINVAFAIVTPNRIEYQPMQTIVPHRGFESHPPENWLLVHMRDYDGKSTIFCLDDMTRIRFKRYMEKGIKFGTHYFCYFGSSNSQLKDQAGWFLALPPGESIDKARERIGALAEIKNVPTYVSRVGLYLTTSRDTGIRLVSHGETVDSPDRRTGLFSSLRSGLSRLIFGKNRNIEMAAYIIPDVTSNDYCFTDGCGTISWGLAIKVARSIGIPIIHKTDVPSAFQVRIAGCKGMLMIDPESKTSDYYIKVRKSMEKFKGNEWSLYVVDHSRPMPLSLNNQVIRLLSDLGNSNGVFESIQSRCLETDGFWHPPAHSYLSALESADRTLMEQKKQKYRDAKHLLLKNKIPLPVNDGRNLFGVADVTGELSSEQCFIQYQVLNSSSEKTYQVVQGTVLVTKSPCLHPGDFRKLEAVYIDRLVENNHDCIVFSTQGARPKFDEIAGSDLDGDQYWVYWGDELQIKTVAEPLIYPAATKKNVDRVTNDLILEYFLDTFTDKAPGVISNTHSAIADKDPKGTHSDACRECAELFARAIDARKTGETIDMRRIKALKERYCQDYPAWMMKFDKPCRDPPSTSINEILFRRAVQARIRHEDLDDILRPLPNINENPDDTIVNLGQNEDDKANPNENIINCCRRLIFLIFLIIVMVGAIVFLMHRSSSKFGH